MDGNGSVSSPVADPGTDVDEEIPLPDLLQLLSTSRKSGVLVLRSDWGVGRIFFRNAVFDLRTGYLAFDDDTRVDPTFRLDAVSEIRRSGDRAEIGTSGREPPTSPPSREEPSLPSGC